jgi:N-acetylglutamate synthase-like GNAT family acetyltransferase
MRPVNLGFCQDTFVIRLKYQDDYLNTNFLINDTRLTLRPMEAGDDEFAYRVYASTRSDEMALVDWTDEQKEVFLRMQVDAQKAHYKIHYLNAEYYIIQRKDISIGRLMIEPSKDFILLMDVALLPEYRNAGIGTTIMTNLMNKAAQVNLPLVLRVEFFNPAIRLYTRLGFVKTREMNVYHEMVWTPGNATKV